MALEPSKADMPLLQVLPSTAEHAFEVPVKRIHESKDVVHFLTSKAYCDIMTFLLQLNRAMFPTKILPTEHDPHGVRVWQKIDIPEGGPVANIQALLRDIEKIIDEIPLDNGPRRFGNVSFRKWYQKVEEQVADLLKKWLQLSPNESQDVTFLDEIIPYFLGSFGSAQRLDYGSGHELSFLAFLGCIWKSGGFADAELGKGNLLSQDDQARAIVLGPMRDYFRLIRRLIKTYTLEPAGSHGVWGLDDHSFLPYIFGSAQYGPAISDMDDTPIEGSLNNAPDPSDVAKIAAVNRYRDNNMYFAAIGFIHDVKTGPFWEHSPMLYDISGVRSGWGKINKVKMIPRMSNTKLLTMGNLGYDQDVQCRSSFQISSRSAFSLRLPLQLGYRAQRATTTGGVVIVIIVKSSRIEPALLPQSRSRQIHVD